MYRNKPIFKISLLILAIAIAAIAQSQAYTIQGLIKDKQSGNAVHAATIMLKNLTDSSNKFTVVSDTSGRFTFTNILPDTFSIIISNIGYGTFTKGIRIEAADINMDIWLNRNPGELEPVTVKTVVSPVTLKGDTVQYNASQFKVNPDATVEDLAKKMPGLTVENGQLKANGDVIQKVTLDGREFFGDDATAAIRNLPAEIVDKIQVFDRLSDQVQFTGVDDGNTTKGLNIVTKANMRNGQFGRAFAGAGTNDRYQAGGNTTKLKENLKLSFVGNFNNINQQNFATQDLLGVVGTTQQGGRGMGGRGGGRGGNNQGNNNASSFLVSQQTGINKTNAFGTNYSDMWGKNIIITGSYFFNAAQNNNNEQLTRQYFSTNLSNISQLNLLASNNINHRGNLRIEYKLDSFNQLIITPNVSVQLNSSDNDAATGFYKNGGIRTSNIHNIINTDKTATNLNSSILYRHAFAKRGRTFSVNLNSVVNNRPGDIYTTQYDTLFYGAGFKDTTAKRFTGQHSNSMQLSTSFIYTEPLGKNTQLQVNYSPAFTKSKADQQAYLYDVGQGEYATFNTALSSKFENNTDIQRGGITYRYVTRENQWFVGVDAQQTSLKSDRTFPAVLQVNKVFSNILPNAMLRLRLNANSNLRIVYRANTQQPTVTQLQDVYDITGLPFVTSGNAQLQQQYMHTLNVRYTYANSKKGTSFVGNIFYQKANNFITNATFVPLSDSVLTSSFTLKSGQQLTKPVNLNGYNSFRSFFNFSIPVKVLRSNFNMNAGATINKLPGLINNQQNQSTNHTYTLGSVLSSNISQYIDFTISYSANINKVVNDINPQLNQKYFSQIAAVQLNILTKKGWFLQNDFNHLKYTGLSEGFNQNYNLWNLNIGKKLFKQQLVDVKVGVFDLLKQNRSISRNITETYIEDQQTQVLTQYFMLTITYKLRTFGKGTEQPARKMRRMMQQF